MISFLLFLSLIAYVNPSLGGDKVLNGGNAIICRSQQNEISQVLLLDLFEAELRGETIKFNLQHSHWRPILEERLQDWVSVAPRRVQLYQAWLDSFEAEAGFHDGIQIPQIPDHGSVAIPRGCDLEPIAFQRPDQEIFPGVKRYIINNQLWQKMSPMHQAGLVLHELIYREAISLGHPNSFPTRFFTGYLASAEPDAFTYAQVVIQMPLAWVEAGTLDLIIIEKVERDVLTRPRTRELINVRTTEVGPNGLFKKVKFRLLQRMDRIQIFDQVKVQNPKQRMGSAGLISTAAAGQPHLEFNDIGVPIQKRLAGTRFEFQLKLQSGERVDLSYGFSRPIPLQAVEESYLGVTFYTFEPENIFYIGRFTASSNAGGGVDLTIRTERNGQRRFSEGLSQRCFQFSPPRQVRCPDIPRAD